MIFIFDYDNVLYPADLGIIEKIDDKIAEFIKIKLNVSIEKAHNIRKDYYNKYGTTIEGLKLHHNINPKEYFDFILDIDLTLKKDSDLINLLNHIEGDKFIFSNGLKRYIKKGLKMLGIHEFFNEIFDIEFFSFSGKPNKESYKKVNQYIKKIYPNENDIIFIDDRLINLYPACNLGWKCFWLKWEYDNSSLNGKTNDITIINNIYDIIHYIKRRR